MYAALTADQLDLQSRARSFAETVAGPRAAETDRSEQYPWQTVDGLTKAGFMGMTIPAEFGGQGRSYADVVLVIEEMARVCGVTARIVVEANMGGVAAVMRYGSDKQKKIAAGLVLAGDKPAICITEPEAGSAATDMTTRADRRGDHYVLNGKKHWITGGGVSTLHVIFARIFDEQGRELGIGGFLAQLGDDGLTVGTREPTMGLRGIPETEIIFSDLMVPTDMALEPPGGFSKGFGRLMEAYNSQRVGAATIAMGLAAGAYDLALAYTKKREQFGRPIAEFQGLQWMLADMATQIDAARLMIHRAAAAADPFPDAMQAAQAKVFASEMSVKVTNDALQLFGARGYSRNEKIERYVRDARMFTIGGGTAQILRTVIASRLLDQKLPQTRDGYADRMEHVLPVAAE